MTPFADLPHEERMALRTWVTDGLGCDVLGYDGPAVTLALPRLFNGLDWHAVAERLHRAGLEVQDWRGQCLTFICRENCTPDHLRHDGPYNGSRGYLMCVRCIPNSDAIEFGATLGDWRRLLRVL